MSNNGATGDRLRWAPTAPDAATQMRRDIDETVINA